MSIAIPGRLRPFFTSPADAPPTDFTLIAQINRHAFALRLARLMRRCGGLAFAASPLTRFV